MGFLSLVEQDSDILIKADLMAAIISMGINFFVNRT
jgi:hypothetical protein